jgi:hypothetical protein
MKTVSIILLYLTYTLSAQGQQLRYGLKGGLNLADIVITNYINPDAESSYNIKPGLHAGIFASVDLNDRFALSSELLYSNKGVKAIDRINLHYIIVPLLTQYKISENFLVEIGPEIGYLFSARSPFGNVSNTWNNKLDIGLDAGLQVRLAPLVNIGIRYNAGFSSVIDTIDESGTNNFPTEEPIKYQNRVLQLFVSYAIANRELR